MSVTNWNWETGSEYKQGDMRRSCINFHDTYLRNREYGFRPKYGDQSRLYCEMYTSLKPIAISETQNKFMYTLEFSPDGKILAADSGCKRLWFFDALTHKSIDSIPQEYQRDGKCLKFLNDRVFATLGNNSTICLWDSRNLSQKMRVLPRGNSQYVNSLEYSAKNNLLVSGGIDGFIKSWDLNRYSEENTVEEDLLCVSGLMSIKLLPDSSKLVISTIYGLVMLISNLDLEKLHSDVHELKPLKYFLMEEREFSTIPEIAAQMFTRKRNRVEFITDFPLGRYLYENGTLTHSIQVHPQGWNIISRYYIKKFRQQYTCVHDIQDLAVPNDLDKNEELISERPNLLGHSLTDDSLYKLIRKSNRLTHFIEEDQYLDYGTSSELSYSNDGRVIFSSSQNGVRLYSFSPKCDELSSIQPKPPAIRLNEIGVINSHRNPVLCTKFSPVHPLLVSGCVAGNIVWYQPRL